MKESHLLNSCTVASERCNCFEKLTDEELKIIEENRVDVKFKKGEVLCKQGSFASHVILLCEGLAKVYLEGAHESLILKIIPKGNLIGLTSLFEGNNIFQYSAQAYQDCVVQLIDINIFRSIIKTNGAFAYEIINLLCENSLQTYGRFFCMTHKHSYGRLADLLLCLSYRVYKNNKFELEITRKELAELSGLSAENVIRMLKKFKDEGLITTNGKTIEIEDKESLQKICDFG